jgi:hypothetical protein
VAPLPALIAHGGLAGAIVETLVVLAVVGVFVAVWLRERRGGSGGGPDEETRLRDDDAASP